jgi:photosystem II stability/assembly factor-like uncharacterized protein
MKERLSRSFYILCLGLACLVFAASCTKKTGADNFEIKWKKLNIPYTDAIQSMYFTSKDTGYAVGSTDYNLTNGTFRSPYLITYDGGETWRADTFRVNRIVVRNLFSNGKDLYLSGNYTGIRGVGDYRALCRSTDKSKTWKTIDSTHFISEVQFWDPARGLAIYSTNLYTTTDSAKHFTLAGHTDPGGYGNAQILSNQLGYVVGGGKINKTTNAGATWTAGPVFTYTSRIINLNFVNANTGYLFLDEGQDGIAGNITPHNNKLFKTTDAGNTWTLIRADLMDKLGYGVGMHFKTETQGYIATLGGIFSTNDSGQTWQQEFDIGTPVANKDINYLYFTPDGVGFAYGTAGIFKQFK